MSDDGEIEQNNLKAEIEDNSSEKSVQDENGKETVENKAEETLKELSPDQSWDVEIQCEDDFKEKTNSMETCDSVLEKEVNDTQDSVEVKEDILNDEESVESEGTSNGKKALITIGEISSEIKLLSTGEKPLADEVMSNFEINEQFWFFGQDLMVEIRKGGKTTYNDCTYFCTTCDKSLSARFLMSHLFSINHNYFYVKALFPNIYGDMSDIKEKEQKEELYKLYQKIYAVVKPVSMTVVLEDNKEAVIKLFKEKLEWFRKKAVWPEFYSQMFNCVEGDDTESAKSKGNETATVENQLEEATTKLSNVSLSNKKKWTDVKILLMRRSYMKGRKVNEDLTVPQITFVDSSHDCDITSGTFMENIKKHAPESFDILILSPFDWVCDPESFHLLGVELTSVIGRFKTPEKTSLKKKIEFILGCIYIKHKLLAEEYPHLKVIWTIPQPINYKNVSMGIRDKKNVNMYDYKIEISIAQFCAILHITRKILSKDLSLPIVHMLNVILVGDAYQTFLNRKKGVNFCRHIDGARIGLGYPFNVEKRMWDNINDLWKSNTDEIQSSNSLILNSKMMKESFLQGAERSTSSCAKRFNLFERNKRDELLKLKVNADLYNCSSLFAYYWNVIRPTEAKDLAKQKSIQSEALIRISQNRAQALITANKNSPNPHQKVLSPQALMHVKPFAKTSAVFSSLMKVDERMQSQMQYSPENDFSSWKFASNYNPNLTYRNIAPLENNKPEYFGHMAHPGPKFINPRFQHQAGHVPANIGRNNGHPIQQMSHRSYDPSFREPNEHSSQIQNKPLYRTDTANQSATNFYGNQSQSQQLPNSGRPLFTGGYVTAVPPVPHPINRPSPSYSAKHPDAPNGFNSNPSFSQNGSYQQSPKQKSVKRAGYSPMCALSILCEVQNRDGYLGVSLNKLLEAASKIDAERGDPMILFQQDDHISLIEICYAKLSKMCQNPDGQSHSMLEPAMKTCGKLLVEIEKFNDMGCANGGPRLMSDPYPSKFTPLHASQGI